MSFWKQALLSLLILCAALWGAVKWIPGGEALLREAGLGPMLELAGFAAPDPSATAQNSPAQAAFGGFEGGGPVVTAQAPGVGRLADSVAAIGDGRAHRSVTVMPKTPGRVAEVLVQSGQRVEAGQVLIRLDSEAEMIALERARLVLDDARDRAERVAQLRGSGASTDLQIRAADLAQRQAELAVREAEFALAQRQVPAPIAGWIGIMATETGTQVGTATEIAQIDDRSVLLVDFRLPERMVGRVVLGDPVEAQALAEGHAMITGRISAIDNRVDPASRTLRVQARLENPDDRLRAGMAFSISIALPGEAAPAVDPLSVQWNREGAYVWVVRDGKAARQQVRILQRSDTEVLVDAAFQTGDLVVVEGVQAVRDGAPVRVQGLAEGALRPASDTAAPKATEAARL